MEISQLNPIDHPIIFLRPLRITDSRRAAHLPFGNLMVEILRPSAIVELGTADGTFYCGVCQAVKELGLEARCYAVETREEEPQAGLHDSKVRADLRGHHDAHYGEFSRLMEAAPDDAVSSFQDGSIDLLILGGMHAYEALRHHFQTWLPKLSERAIVLFFDIERRRPDSGAWRLWSEVSVKFPHFAFQHADGLGVLGVGPETAPGLNTFFSRTGGESANIEEFFSYLGSQITSDFESEEKLLKLAAELSESGRRMQALTEDKDRNVQQLRAQVAQKERAMQEAQAHMERVTSGPSWKLILALQKLRVWLLPFGSSRERLARSVLHGLHSLRSNGVAVSVRAVSRRFAAAARQSAARHGSAQAGGSGQAAHTRDIKKTTESLAMARLNIFLSTDAILEFPTQSSPLVSIILLFYNRAEASLQCLETLSAAAGDVPFEVVIIDNASTDQSSLLLERIRNAKIVRNLENKGFGGGCNQAADLASGKYLLFLNNDTQLIPNSLKVLVETLESGNTIGAVGGKLIYPDGRLQEAGSIIWQDGTCVGYGRHDDPFKPEYCYKRDVDFCSAAMLLTPRELFFSLGKFDSRYQPAYYEDADYCLQLWENGYRVMYQPFAVAVHYEYGSEGMTGALALQRKNWEQFRKKWRTALNKYHSPGADAVVLAREHREHREHQASSKRILYFDDHTPDYRLGVGYPRTYRILETLADLGYQVTYLPVLSRVFVPEIVQPLQKKGVEILYDSTNQRIDMDLFLQSRPDYYDVVMVSRPHNMRLVRGYLAKYAGRAACIYDAEALFSLRDLRLNELRGISLPEPKKKQLIQDEVDLVKGADVVTAVSPSEKAVFQKYGATRVEILSHVVSPEPTPAAFEDRRGLLFVGGILDSPSPNEDAVLYFAREILPLIRRELSCEFYVVGSNRVKSIWDLESEFIHIVGRVEDLRPYYDACRVFVVPARYAGGIPLKMLDAAAHGLPGVVTPLIASQLGWEDNQEILIGRDPLDFAARTISLYSERDIFYRLRTNALQRVRSDYSPEHFGQALRSVVELAADIRSSKRRD